MLVIRQSFIIAGKDMKQFFKDRFGVAFALAFPLLFVFAFSLAFGDVGPDDNELVLTVALRDDDQIASLVAESLALGDNSAVAVMSYVDAEQALADRSIRGFVAFPAGYGAMVRSGGSAPLEVVVGDDNLDLELSLVGLARDITARVGAIGLAIQAAVEVAGPSTITSATLDELAGRPPLLSFADEQVAEIRAVGAANLTLPGYLTMFVFFAAALSAESIARERQTHTLERLLANGTRRTSILIGKLLSSIYRGFLQLAVLWVVGILAFRIDFGASPVAAIVVSILMVFASAAFGVMLASMIKSVRTAASAAVLASLTLAPLGGSWWPLFIAPDWQQQLAKITPHGWANTAFNKLMLFGAEGRDVIGEMAALVGFAALFIVVAMLRFRTTPPA